MTANEAPLPTRYLVVWFLGDCYVPRELIFDGTVTPLTGIRVTPLEVEDSSFPQAVDAFVRQAGTFRAEFRVDVTRSVVAVAIVVDAPSPNEAAEQTVEPYRKVALTLGVRQYGAGRPLGWIAWNTRTHEVTYRSFTVRPRQVMHLPFVDERVEVIHQLNRIHESSQGPAFAQLYIEACTEANQFAAVARFWSILEALGDKLRRNKEQRVREVLRRGRQGDPTVNGVGVVKAAYDIRNSFLHEGRTTDPQNASDVADVLREATWFVLFHAGFQPYPRHIAGDDAQ